VKYSQIVYITLYFIIFSSNSVDARRISKEKHLKNIADSIHIADSLNRLDSIRIADSLCNARYKFAEEQLNEEESTEMELNRVDSQYLVNAVATYGQSVSYESDDKNSVHEIIIDNNSTTSKKLDSIETLIDSFNTILYRNNSRYNQMKTYSVKDKKAFMQFLVKNNIKDTSEIINCCQLLYGLSELEQQKLFLILETQSGDNRAVLHLHLKRVRNELEELSRFLLSLSPQVPQTQIKSSTRTKRFLF